MTENIIPSGQRIRLALVGCGRISKNHFDAIGKIDDLELVSVCDIVPERAQQAGADGGCIKPARTSRKWRSSGSVRVMLVPPAMRSAASVTSFEASDTTYLAATRRG